MQEVFYFATQRVASSFALGVKGTSFEASPLPLKAVTPLLTRPRQAGPVKIHIIHS